MRRNELLTIALMAVAYAATALAFGREWTLVVAGAIGIAGGAALGAICLRRFRRRAQSD